MNIPNKILTEAIEFAMLDPEVKIKIKQRDEHPHVRAREIRAKILYPIPENGNMRIIIGIEFERKNQSIRDGEDIMIKMIYHPASGYIIDKG